MKPDLNIPNFTFGQGLSYCILGIPSIWLHLFDPPADDLVFWTGVGALGIVITGLLRFFFDKTAKGDDQIPEPNQ